MIIPNASELHKEDGTTEERENLKEMVITMEEAEGMLPLVRATSERDARCSGRERWYCEGKTNEAQIPNHVAPRRERTPRAYSSGYIPQK